MASDAEVLASAYRTLIAGAGDDLGREGLAATPARAARAWQELTSGLTSPPPPLTTFDAEGYDQMIVVRDLPLFSLCEHHLLPFHGVAHIAYLPGGRILGLSKFARLVDHLARRLQVQERLTQQVAAQLAEALAPAGLLVVVEAEHLCMAMRGVQKLGSKTRTSCATGAMLKGSATRAEALALMGLG